MPELPDPVLTALPVFAAFLLLEFLYGCITGRVRFGGADTLASLAMGAGNMASGLIFGSAVVWLALTLHDHRLLDIGWHWSVLTLAFVGDDFAYYWFHRSAHRVRWFWASHVVHHSSQFLNLSTAVRQSWTGPLSLSVLFRLPFIWLGVPPTVVFFVIGANLVYQLWLHTEVVGRLPAWVEAVFNTPSHHRVHHATNPRYLDANYGGIFIVWDKLFGTFVAEQADERCRYGLIFNLTTFNPLRIAFHEWVAMAQDVVAAQRIRDRIFYLFGPPGWTPDGSRATTDDVKMAWRTAHQPAE